MLGNGFSSRVAKHASVETMVLCGSLLQASAIAVLGSFILAGALTPASLFVPGALSTFAQGLSIPNAQAGAIRVKPHLAGTAAGIGMFTQFFTGSMFSQFYTLVADGTPGSLVITASLSVSLAVVTGCVPYVLKHRSAQAQ